MQAMPAAWALRCVRRPPPASARVWGSWSRPHWCLSHRAYGPHCNVGPPVAAGGYSRAGADPVSPPPAAQAKAALSILFYHVCAEEHAAWLGWTGWDIAKSNEKALHRAAARNLDPGPFLASPLTSSVEEEESAFYALAGVPLRRLAKIVVDSTIVFRGEKGAALE
ncbi:hypothetical protein ZWY2020_029581 [Hordeum vulgare]|nr:hypothetical protein ZWY2020_029581 [Hordeum vulgare]